MMTKRQKQILDFIADFSRRNGLAPTIDEIRRHFRLNSVATIHQHLEALRSKGYLDRTKHKTRSISLEKNNSVGRLLSRAKRSGFTLVPVLGSANAGPATIFAEENIEAYRKVSRSVVRKQSGIFAVKVEGDSMNRSRVLGNNLDSGDLAIIDSELQNPNDGDYILAVLNGCATLKKFRKDSRTGDIMLMSESSNPKHKPIYVSNHDDFMVNGKIIGVVKK